MGVPEYNRPWPDDYSFNDREPDWFDDLEVKRRVEEGELTDECGRDIKDKQCPSCGEFCKRKREWVGLTDDELPKGATYEFDRGVRWAEAKLKEKNT